MIRVGLFLILFFQVACQNQGSTDYMTAEGLSLYSAEKMDAALERQKLPLESRLLTIQSLWMSLKSSYVGYATKNHLIGLSVDEVMAQCLAEENKHPTASFSFEFDGRLRACVGALKDGHLFLGKIPRSLRVLSPVMNLEQIENKFYVSQINKNLFQELIRRKYIPEEISSNFNLGVQILSLDGLPIADAVQQMRNYTSASGEQSRLREATELLFARSFNYPTSPTHKIKFKTANSENILEIDLPWLLRSRTASDNFETPAWLKGKGIQKQLSDYGLQSALPQGLNFDQDLFLLKDRQAFESLESERSLATLGTIAPSETQQHHLCYLRIESFSIGSTAPDYKVRHSVARTVHNFLDVLANFLRTCDQQQKKLILDLRYNSGGNAVFAEAFANLLSKKSDPIFARGQSLHLRSGLIPFFQRSIHFEASANIRSSLWLEGLSSGSESMPDVSPWLIFHRKSQTRAAFEGPLLTLTSAHCISACENTVHFLKLTGRGLIAGEETHGTGFGFATNGEAQTLWRDPMNMFELEIPNNAFSYFEIAGPALAEDNEFAAYIREVQPKDLNENRPRQVDLQIPITVNDILRNWTDYKVRVLELTRSL